MPTIETTGHKNPERPDASTETIDACPICGTEIEAFSAKFGPSTHIISPCGCSVGPLTIRDLVGGGR